MTEITSRSTSLISENPPRPAPRADSGRWLAGVRIAFGAVWAVDAFLKWQPAFTDHFLGLVTGAEDGQPALVRSWIAAWAGLLGTQPHVFAYLLAVAETVLAAGLLLGAFTNALCVLGTLLSLLIWSTAEGFGGPYQPGSADIGASVIYALVFIALLAARAGARAGLDPKLRPWLARSRFPKSAWLCGASPDTGTSAGTSGADGPRPPALPPQVAAGPGQHEEPGTAVH